MSHPSSQEAQGREARVRVPASTSNLGGGFDCVGAAVPRWLTASVSLTQPGQSMTGMPPTMRRGGTLASFECDAKDDLLCVGFSHACIASGRAMPDGLSFEVTSDIPVARGLGSSAAALVAGARLANDLLGLRLSSAEVATICARIEGHGDNVGAAALGGAVLSLVLDEGWHNREYTFAPLAVSTEIAFAFAVADFAVSTSAARALLPREVPHQIAVAAAARAAALVRGLETGDPALLRHALDDVLHVPFRRRLIKGYDAVVAAGVDAGAIGVTLSGSGSTLVALTPARLAADVADAMCEQWRRLGVSAEPLSVSSFVDPSELQPLPTR